MPLHELEDEDDVVRVTLELPTDVWEMLQEVTGMGQNWQDVAIKALEAGLEQVSAPTNATARVRQSSGR